MKKYVLASAVAAAFAAGLFAAQFGAGGAFVPDSLAGQEPAAQPTTSATPVATVSLPDFSALVEREGGAVVNVRVSEKAKGGGPMAGPGRGAPDPFEDFFRRFQPPQGRQGDGPVRHALGSGFIVSQDGYILTNAHVVSDADEVIVKLIDRREFPAKVVGLDKRTDVAVLKIDASGLPTVEIGESDSVKVGSWVAAIGSPFGLENTVTAGIVSATSRNLPSDAYVPFIQTDVAVNPGNSGGPLFNLKGQVIGINSQIYSRTGGYMGLSFAIPIDVAMKVKNDLLQYGKVQRGRIGVTIQQVSKDLASTFGMDRPRGALVSSVEKGSPAERAGLKVGDVIVAVNGDAVDQSIDLPRMIGEGRPGAKYQLEIWRDGKSQDLPIVLGEMPSETLASAGPAVSQAQLGLVVRPLSDAEKARLQTQSGVVVEDVDGPAAKAGIRRGDVIIALNSEPIDSAAMLKSAIENAKDRVAVLIQRNDARFFVPVPLS
ncbi:MAG: Do family serine endopeptidase [Betaproteobacteria bacterium]|nr:Do family serine endopeptidase [Betaproteobacteria bacterium]